MPRWLGKKEAAGWTAVDCGLDGVYGVSVLAPVSASLGGKPRVVRCAAAPGGLLDVDTLTTLSKKISVGGFPWTLPLGRKEYSVLVVPEPSVLPAEMQQSIRWSISAMIDYPTDEANISWMKIPMVEGLPNRPQHLYVMVARNELVTRLGGVFRAAKIHLQAIDVRETAQRNIAALAERQGEGLGLLLAGRQGTQFTITFKGELYLDRFVEESLFDLARIKDEEAEARAFERIALHVQRSLDFVGRTLPFISLGRVLVAPMPAANGFVDYLAKNLPSPVEKLNLASIFDFTQTPELAREENQAGYFTALGSALRFMKKTT